MDWDLNAIVRSCSSSATNSSPKSTTVAGQNSQPPATLEAEDNPFVDFSDLMNPNNNDLQEFQSSFRPFLANSTGKSNFLDSPVSDIRAVCCPFPPPETAVNLHQNQRQQLHHQIQASNAILPMRKTQSSASRPRKKKNSQKKLVMQVAAENLSKDVWAWRKYGQKPIKGSPYPRNYYRCSSSKGCTARKQVERSNTDPNLFTVSYTGDHCHPRPAHRNSLAGSVRTKIPVSQNPGNSEQEVAPASGGKEIDGLSPTTTLSKAAENEVNGEFFAGEGVAEETEVEDEDVLIPNMSALDEDLIESLNLQRISGGGDGGRRNLDFGDEFAGLMGGSAGAGGS